MERQVHVRVVRPNEYPNEGPDTKLYIKLNFCLLQPYFREPVREDQKQCIAMAIIKILKERLEACCVEENLENHKHTCHIVQMTFDRALKPGDDVENVEFVLGIFREAKEHLKWLSRVAWAKPIFYPFEGPGPHAVSNNPAVHSLYRITSKTHLLNIAYCYRKFQVTIEKFLNTCDSPHPSYPFGSFPGSCRPPISPFVNYRDNRHPTSATVNMCNWLRRGSTAEQDEEQRARDVARAEAREQREQELMNTAYETLLAQDPSPPRSLVGVLVCYPENSRFNLNRRRDVGRYLRNAIHDRVHARLPRSEPAFHLHECRIMAVILKDDGRYPQTSQDFINHLNRRALDAVNAKLVPSHPNHRIQYSFVTDGLMLALVRLPVESRRNGLALRFFSYP
ncbi:hypothetical protein P170DRAFT_425671 [Aspergillus steynii IBT 23096]|uniref:Uncharacterized protein n=1 Tax=Aspergillus steynii IBT 23096 TaxID=1392250 RepID=A0A2I2G6Y0_9EURO|nr:uncharacterized protein P170DRAFT_425671 [Aspergillus steynii IBT 23096]PLB48633.1 hypothetical protein P170DRAFT_425671 [Aspergillus steynii IBT 23096]